MLGRLDREVPQIGQEDAGDAEDARRLAHLPEAAGELEDGLGDGIIAGPLTIAIFSHTTFILDLSSWFGRLVL